MARCSGIKGDGSRCEGIAKAGESYCYAHDPERADERRRNASRGGTRAGRGRARLSPEIPAIKARILELVENVLEGNVERSSAAVVGNLYYTLRRAVEVERKIKETEDLERRIAALEEQQNGGVRRWEKGVGLSGSSGAARVAPNAGSDRGRPSACGSTAYPQNRGALPR
jgi:hypothetical protein